MQWLGALSEWIVWQWRPSGPSWAGQGGGRAGGWGGGRLGSRGGKGDCSWAGGGMGGRGDWWQGRLMGLQHWHELWFPATQW